MKVMLRLVCKLLSLCFVWFPCTHSQHFHAVGVSCCITMLMKSSPNTHTRTQIYNRKRCTQFNETENSGSIFAPVLFWWLFEYFQRNSSFSNGKVFSHSIHCSKIDFYSYYDDGMVNFLYVLSSYRVSRLFCSINLISITIGLRLLLLLLLLLLSMSMLAALLSFRIQSALVNLKSFNIQWLFQCGTAFRIQYPADFKYIYMYMRFALELQTFALFCDNKKFHFLMNIHLYARTHINYIYIYLCDSVHFLHSAFWLTLLCVVYMNSCQQSSTIFSQSGNVCGYVSVR